MKLLFKQRFFSWFDSYDIYNEAGETVYTVEGKLSWGHCLHILDAAGNHIGTVKERVLTLLPKFELYENDEYIGSIQKAFTFFAPKFDIDCNGWQVQNRGVGSNRGIISTSTAGTSKATGRNGTTPSPGRMGQRWQPSPKSCSTGRIPMSSTW